MAHLKIFIMHMLVILRLHIILVVGCDSFEDIMHILVILGLHINLVVGCDSFEDIMHMLVILRLIAVPSERMDANDAFTCLKHLHPPNHFGVKN